MSGSPESGTAEAELRPSPEGEANPDLARRQREAMGGRFALNVLSNYAGFFVNLVTNLYLTRYLLHRLGPDVFGAWLVIGSVLIYLGLVDLGFGSSIQKYVAEYAAEGEEDRIGRLMVTTLLMFSAFGVVILLLSAAACPLFGPVFKVPAQSVSEVRLALVLMGVVQGIGLPLGVFSGTLSGLQRMDLNNFISILGALGNFVLVLVFVRAGLGLPGIALAYLAVALTIGAVRFTAVKRLLPRLRLTRSHFDAAQVRQTSSYGLVFFGLKIAHLVRYNTFSFVISAAISSAAVTSFGVANRLATMSRQLVEQAVEVLIPVFSQLDRLQDQQKTRSIYVQAGKMTVGIAAPLTLFICAFANPILDAWLVEVPDKAPLLTVILAVTVFASIVPAVSVRLMLGVAKHKTLAVVTLIDSLANLAISIALVKPYGVVGVAYGTMIPLIISHVLIFPWLGCRIIAMNTSWFLWVLARAAFVPLVPAGLFCWLALTRLPHTGGIPLLLLGACTCAIYAAAFVVWSLDEAEREMLLSRFRRRTRAAAEA